MGIKSDWCLSWVNILDSLNIAWRFLCTSFCDQSSSFVHVSKRLTFQKGRSADFSACFELISTGMEVGKRGGVVVGSIETSPNTNSW